MIAFRHSRVSLPRRRAAWLASMALASMALASMALASMALAQDDGRQAMQLELQRLQGICQTLHLQAEADILRRWLPAQRDDCQLLFLPEPPSVAVDENSARANWAKYFNAARARYAEALFAQAQQRAEAGDEAAAFKMLWHVLREDSGHAEAKRILGTLATAASVRPRLRKGTTVHPDFGWPAGSYSRIETPHFLLTTRGDPQASLELALQMESFYALWRQVFYNLWAPPGMLTHKFAGRNTPWERSLEMQVTLLRDRQDYLAILGVAEQKAAISVGYYSPQLKRSFFFADPGLQATFLHELTHQMFAEATRIDAAADAGSLGGIWLIEGIALYMESLTNRGSYWTLGGLDAPRLQTARYRAIRDGFWVEWQKFTSGGREAWKEDPQIALFYTQATGLTHWFMDQAAQPTARDRLFKALVAVYQNDLDFDGLRALLGSDDSAAKLTYQQGLTLTDRDIEVLQAAGLPCESLVLAGSELSPTSWRSLEIFAPQLQWLDVSFSNADSRDLQWLEQAAQLHRLSVEGTHCDGKLLAIVARLPALTELDLSGCGIDDAALETLRNHPTLETLWITKTQVTERALATLATLSKLKFCDVAGTGIAVQSWEKFAAEHMDAKNTDAKQ